MLTNVSVVDRTVKWQHFPPVTLLDLVLVSALQMFLMSNRDL